MTGPETARSRPPAGRDGACSLQCTHDEDDRDVSKFVAEQATAREPVLAWADPDPEPSHLPAFDKLGFRADFAPLAKGTPEWQHDIVLAEARLFWPDAALHVVAKVGGGCRWAKVEEMTSGQNVEEQATDNANLRIKAVLRTSFRVLTLRDHARFGIEDWPKDFEKLTAIEYRQAGRLVAWRLAEE